MSVLMEMLEKTANFISASKSILETGINQSFPLSAELPALALHEST